MEIDEYIPQVYLHRIIKHRKKHFLYVLESEATIDIQDAEIVPRSSWEKIKGTDEMDGWEQGCKSLADFESERVWLELVTCRQGGFLHQAEYLLAELFKIPTGER